MKPSKKRHPVTSTLMGAIEDGMSTLEELRDEVREVVDNAEGGLANTQRIATLTETADSLDQIVDHSAPELSQEVCDISVNYTVNIRKSQTRSIRRDNAVNALNAAKDALEEWLNDEKTEFETPDDENDYMSHRAMAEEAATTLDDWIANAEGVEFPGMMG